MHMKHVSIIDFHDYIMSFNFIKKFHYYLLRLKYMLENTVTNYIKKLNNDNKV